MELKLKNTLNVISKTSSKRGWSNVKVCKSMYILENIQYAIHREKTDVKKNFLRAK